MNLYTNLISNSLLLENLRYGILRGPVQTTWTNQGEGVPQRPRGQNCPKFCPRGFYRHPYTIMFMQEK